MTPRTKIKHLENRLKDRETVLSKVLDENKTLKQQRRHDIEKMDELMKELNAKYVDSVKALRLLQLVMALRECSVVQKEGVIRMLKKKFHGLEDCSTLGGKNGVVEYIKNHMTDEEVHDKLGFGLSALQDLVDVFHPMNSEGNTTCHRKPTNKDMQNGDAVLKEMIKVMALEVPTDRVHLVEFPFKSCQHEVQEALAEKDSRQESPQLEHGASETLKC